MKNDRVHIFRQAIGKVIEMLVDRKIEVTQRGTDAYVQADPKTGRPFLVNIPHVPDEAPDELLDAIGGFVDHEIGHVLETDFEAVKEGQKYGPFVVSMHNILEDIRIERLMEKRFRGSQYNLKTLHKFFLEKMTAPMLNDAIRSGDKNRIISVLVPPLVRSMGGQDAFKEFMSSPSIADHIKEFFDAVKHLAPEIAKMESTKDALELARKFDKCARITGGKSVSELREGKGPSKKSEKASIGEESKSKLPKESKKSAGSETEVIDEKAESLEGERIEDLEGRVAAPAPEEERAEDEELEGVDLEDEEESSSSSSGEIGDFAEERDSRDHDPDHSGDFSEEGEGGFSGSDFEEGEGGAPSYDVDSVGSGIGDFDSAAGKVIGEDARKATSVASYKVFTHDFDVIEPLPLKYGADTSHVTKMEDQVLHMVGPMQKDLERIISARSLASWSSGHRSGKLHGASLVRVITGDPRVFRRRHETETKDVALSLVIDASGSMDGTKIRNATFAAYALSSVLERIGIKHEVIAFTTLSRGSKAASKAIAAGAEGGSRGARTFSRWEPLYMPVIKGFDERIDSQIKLRFASLPMINLCNNVDGESIAIAARRLVARKEKGKTMIVLSDGMPAADGDMKALNVHLKKIVQDIEASNVRVVGLGIQSEAVRSFYKRHVVLNDVKDLPTTVMKELKAALLD